MPKRDSTSLTLKRVFKAPAEKVFAAWTRPEALKLWFGPADDLTVPLAETDLRVGGRYRIIARMANGDEHRVGGVYREIVPDRKLVFTWAWESTPERESLVTVEIEPVGEGCRLTLTHERFQDETTRDRHRYGWTGSLDKLERLLAGKLQQEAPISGGST
ncbi:MAG TPA: SRPBCC domain-containing protein [Hyphomicrobiaceae bacterium]|nr:SRPBCC domain-containing protein [Hyphomicrobiaceae bacterium]